MHDDEELDFEYETPPNNPPSHSINNSHNNSLYSLKYRSHDSSIISDTDQIKIIQNSFIKMENLNDEYNRNFMHNFDDNENIDNAQSITIDSDSDSLSGGTGCTGEFSSRSESSLLRSSTGEEEEEIEDCVEEVPPEEVPEDEPIVPYIPNSVQKMSITFNNITKQRYLKTSAVRKRKWARYKPYFSNYSLKSSDSVIEFVPECEEKKYNLDNQNEEYQAKRHRLEDKNEAYGTKHVPNNFVIRIDKVNDQRTVNSGPSEISFKMPLKRPPQRTKSISTTSKPNSIISNDDLRTISNLDDSISILGSEIDNETVVDNNEYFTRPPIKEEESSVWSKSNRSDSVSDDESMRFKSSQPDTDSYIPEFIPPEFVPPQFNGNGNNDRIKNWIETTSPAVHHATNFNEVPYVFRGLCYPHFLNPPCRRNNCSLAHILATSKLKVRLEKVNDNELVGFYKFCVKHSVLYNQVFLVFAQSFGERKMYKEIVQIIEDLFSYKSEDSLVSTVNHIIKIMQDSFEFEDAVEYIIIQIGLSKLPTLDIVLIKVIMMEANFLNYWTLIRKLLIGKKDLDKDIACNIIAKLVMNFPIDKKLAHDIYSTLIKNGNKGLIDRHEISRDILDPLEMVLKNLQPFPQAQVQPTQNVIAFPSQNQNFNSEYQTFKDQDDRVYPGSYYSASISDAGCSSSVHDYEVNEMPNLESRARSVSVTPPLARQQNSSAEMEFDNLVGTPGRQAMQYVPEVMTKKKPPSKPTFGNLILNKNYIMEESLHIFYPENLTKLDKVNIDEFDVIRLNTIIKESNGAAFLEVLNKYKGAVTVENFISMTLAHIQGQKHNMHNFSKLVDNIEVEEPSYWTNKTIRAILEVITFNVTFLMARKGLWHEAAQLLHKFTNWDTLITSMILSQHRITIMGRYIYIAKVFAHAKNFNFVYEILQHPKLNLFENCSKWPHFYTKKHDIRKRNEVLKIFLDEGYKFSITSIAQIYKRVYQNSNIYMYDVQPHLNPMIKNIINSNMTIALKGLSKELHTFYKVVTKENLRAFIICLYKYLENKENALNYYSMGVEKEAFPKITGYEDSIPVKTNMLDEEIEMILAYFFYKRKLTKKIGDLKIEIGLPHSTSNEGIVMLNVNRSLRTISDCVVSILSNTFKIKNVESHRLLEIVIRAEELQIFL